MSILKRLVEASDTTNNVLSANNQKYSKRRTSINSDYLSKIDVSTFFIRKELPNKD